MTTEKPATITVASVDEWEGMYYDDDLVFEHHNVTLDLIEKQADGKPFIFKAIRAYDTNADQYVIDNGGFPKSLSDLDTSPCKVNNPWA